MKNKKINNKFRTTLLVLTLLFIAPLVLASANYGEGAYGAGIYGQASCGDAVCESGETCSSCSTDCGVCAPGQIYGAIIEYKFIEKIRSWDNISSGNTVVMDNFDEDYGINSISILVEGESKKAKITVKKYHSKPSAVSIEAPGILYKYLQIETENFENLSKATLNLKIMKSWVSENNVDSENISLYRFSESLEEWRKLDTDFSYEDEEDYFYDTVLSSFSFFAISGESEIPVIPGADLISGEDKEKETKSNKNNLLWVISIILMFSSLCLLIVIIIISKEDKDIEFLKSKQRYDYLTRSS